MAELFCPVAILAYFDPGAGSIVVQSLVGGLAGFLVFGHYLWASLVDRLRTSSSQGDHAASVSTMPDNHETHANHA